MRIGMILDAPFPPDSRVENQMLSLQEAGHTIILLCLDYSGRQALTESYKGIRVIRVRPSRWWYKLSALAYTLPLYHLYFRGVIKDFAIKQQIEALHVHDLQIARAAFWANRSLQLPLVLDLHENRPNIMQHYRHVQSFWGRLLISAKRWACFEARYIRRADRVVVVTQSARDHYCRNLGIKPDKFVVVPNTVRREFYSQALRQVPLMDKLTAARRYILLYAGETGRRRGLETVIRALPYLKDCIPEIALVVVGKSKDDESYYQLVDKLGLRDYVYFEGWQDVSKFPAYISASHIGLCPLYKNLHHDTTFANKVFQYLALGKPVVVSNCDAQENLINKYDVGVVFAEQDSASFGQAVLKLYQQPEVYARQSKNAKQATINYLNWETSSKGLLSMYHQLATTV